MPHTPPQNAREITAGAWKGGTGAMFQGARGENPPMCSSHSKPLVKHECGNKASDECFQVAHVRINGKDFDYQVCFRMASLWTFQTATADDSVGAAAMSRAGIAITFRNSSAESDKIIWASDSPRMEGHHWVRQVRSSGHPPPCGVISADGNAVHPPICCMRDTRFAIPPMLCDLPVTDPA